MSSTAQIACSEAALGRELVECWELAQRVGVDGIEIVGSPEDLHRRLGGLRRALRAGVVISTVCVGPPFLGSFEAGTIGEGVRAVKLALSIAGELQATGIVMPVAVPPGSPGGAVQPYVVEALADLAAHAESVGTAILVEPLNRYEDGALNRLEQALSLCTLVRADALFITADFFHMNIEESNPARAILDVGDRLGHVHVADSNRLQPGQGHLGFPLLLAALRRVDFSGWLTLECAFRGELEPAVREAVKVLRNAWSSSASQPTVDALVPGR